MVVQGCKPAGGLCAMETIKVQRGQTVMHEVLVVAQRERANTSQLPVER